MNFVLASKSPRRSALLKEIGLEFDVVVSSVDESSIPKDLPPHIYVQELAMLKSTHVASSLPKGTLVIGADTVVVSEDEIIGKPKDFDDAFRMLSSFSGSSHKVVSGISVTCTDDLKQFLIFVKRKYVFQK